MTRWQRRLRLFIGLFFAVFAVIVFFAFRQRAPSTLPRTLNRLDPHAVVESTGGLYIDVKNYTSFASVSTGKPINNGVFDTNTTYAPGGPGNIVVVRLMYQWPVYVSLLGLSGLSDTNGGKRLLVATMAFRNEPY